MASDPLNLRVLIVDDEPLARQRLRELLADIATVTVVGEAGDGQAAATACAAAGVDVVLLDIRMPGIDGLDTARLLAGLPRAPAVVFLTAYDDRAIEAFEAGAVDYLLKPVRPGRLRQALERARRLAPPDIDAIAAADTGRERRHFLERRGGSVRLVAIADVLYLRAEDKYVCVVTDADEFLIEESLVAIEREFGPRFLRIHRNCLVAADRVRALERGDDGERVRLEGLAEPLDVSRRNLPAVREHLRGRAFLPPSPAGRGAGGEGSG